MKLIFILLLILSIGGGIFKGYTELKQRKIDRANQAAVAQQSATAQNYIVNTLCNLAEKKIVPMPALKKVMRDTFVELFSDTEAYKDMQTQIKKDPHGKFEYITIQCPGGMQIKSGV